ncbi:MAG: 23S rRNA (pseudouridine(1915)-N(3))-methyltransferase RlmH, partial [Gammaproteobacteria bacterium]
VRLIALDMAGRQWDTTELSRRLAGWLADGRDMVFAIGGPDGLDGAVLERAELAWSLSALTFPHAVVRILVVEQQYRAWSILRNHPYHRA